jgi:kinesin family protein 11
VLGHRPKSAASKPLSVSQMVGPSDRKTSTKEEAPTTNIQVAIRCRRRSAKEVEEKSAAVVTIDEASGNEVTVELAATTSTFGVVSLPPTRTYAFDTVFGPDADQATIYQTIVAPMLTEVLQGYNCTLFAYGQTGTGKT